jgi:hypothetical protein
MAPLIRRQPDGHHMLEKSVVVGARWRLRRARREPSFSSMPRWLESLLKATTLPVETR